MRGRRYTVRHRTADQAMLAGPRGGMYFANAVPASGGLVWEFVGDRRKHLGWLAQAGDGFRLLDDDEAGLRFRIAGRRPDLAGLLAACDIRGETVRAQVALTLVQAAGSLDEVPPAGQFVQDLDFLLGS